MTGAAPAVVIDSVSKGFTLRHNRSIKGLVVSAVRGKDVSNNFLAVDAVSACVEEGETVGLLGLNGSGKSTLLKLISGVLRPDTGTVRVRGSIAGLIEVGAGLHPELTGRENIFLNGAILGMSEAEISRRFDEIVDFSEIEKFLDTEVKFYSSGMHMRLGFSVAVHTEPEIFLIDEIFAVGDRPFKKKCMRRIRELRDSGRTLVVVSHNARTITRVCSRGLVLQEGRLVYDGPARTAVTYLDDIEESEED